MLDSRTVGSTDRGPDVGRSEGEIRILRLFSRLNIGGPSLHVVLLTAGLEERGYRTRLVIGQEAPGEGNLLDFAAERGVRCLRMAGLGREIRPLADLWVTWELFRLMRREHPHIVHTHTAKAGAVGRVAAILARTPIVVHTYHGHVLSGYFGQLKTFLFRTIEALLARGTDVLVAVSAAVKRDLVGLGVAADAKVRVVPLGLELDRFTADLPRGRLRRGSEVSPESPLVGIVGRLVPIKDVSTFLAAARRVVAERPAVRFAVVGDGECRRALEEEAHRLGLAGTVHFHGWQRDLAAVYGDLDVVVNSSRNEGTPVSLIEALAAARPVVATAVGGTPDVLGEDRGWLVPPADPRALADSILGVLADPQAARRRALAGRSHVLASYSAARLVDDIDALYRELLEARR